MTKAMQLLCRVVRSRISKGEALDAVLADYPKLTEEQKTLVRENMK